MITVTIRHTGGGPTPDHRIFPAGQTTDRHFERERSHVLVGNRVGLAVAGADRVEVYQVEHLAEIDHEAVFALPHKYAARCAAARYAHIVDETPGIALVVGDGFGADIVGGLEKHLAPQRLIAYGLTPAVAHQRQRIRLLHVESRPACID